jgi:arylsulfatase A-like enzyme
VRGRPNILLILNDDMGYSDLGCYGGEIHTPHLDAMAAAGLRFTQFYNTARCCPSRASLLTGLYPHQADIGHMTGDDGVDGYLGDLSQNTVTMAEALKTAGYRTYMSGKWHVTRHIDGPKHNWPCQRGFDAFYGIITGAANYYHPLTLTRNNERIEASEEDYFLTDAISDEAVRQIREHANAHSEAPFFQYVAYTAPHWPLHAHRDDIARYDGRFDEGWDALRRQRLVRMVEMGIIDEEWALTERDPRVGPWEDEPEKAWQTRRMEVYAAQVDRMDQGIGRIVQSLKDTDQWQNTLIVFLSDNGGCAEELSGQTAEWIRNSGEKTGTLTTRDGTAVRFGNRPDVMPGGEETYASYGIPWANVSNTPFRLYKHWVHEGGIATPLIAHWPAGITASGELRHQPAQLPDLMATFLDVGGASYPAERVGRPVQPCEGFSIVPAFADRSTTRDVLYWEHEGNKAIRRGGWKLVRKYPGSWELYDMEADRTEMNNLASAQLAVVAELKTLYEAWAERCNVIPYAELLELRRRRSEGER